MKDTPPIHEVLAKVQEMQGHIKELKASPAFHWFLEQLHTKRDKLVSDLTTLRSLDETRMQQGNLAAFDNLVKEERGELTCPLLDGLAQQAKKILPPE